MNTGEILVANISKIKMSLIKDSVFSSTEEIENILKKFVDDKEKFSEYLKLMTEFNETVSANIHELHQNLEIFYTDEEELRNARKKANVEFKSHMEKICSSNFVNEMFNKEQERREKELKEKERFIEIDGTKYEVLKKIDVLWSGWECDQYAYLVETEGERKLVVSDHGCLKFSSIQFLEDKLMEYEKSLFDTKEMLSLLKEQ